MPQLRGNVRSEQLPRGCRVRHEHGLQLLRLQDGPGLPLGGDLLRQAVRDHVRQRPHNYFNTSNNNNNSKTNNHQHTLSH